MFKRSQINDYILTTSDGSIVAQKQFTQPLLAPPSAILWGTRLFLFSKGNGLQPPVYAEVDLYVVNDDPDSENLERVKIEYS